MCSNAAGLHDYCELRNQRAVKPARKNPGFPNVNAEITPFSHISITGFRPIVAAGPLVYSVSQKEHTLTHTHTTVKAGIHLISFYPV